MHHIQKVLAFFAGMRAFMHTLQNEGHRLLYLKLDDPDNRQSITANLDRIIERRSILRFEYQRPDEYRLDRQLRHYCKTLSIPCAVHDSEHFLTERTEVSEFFENKKEFKMESFYRRMRRQTHILMDGNGPVGDRWNFDAENRKRYDGKVPVPAPWLWTAIKMEGAAQNPYFYAL